MLTVFGVQMFAPKAPIAFVVTACLWPQLFYLQVFFTFCDFLQFSLF